MLFSFQRPAALSAAPSKLVRSTKKASRRRGPRATPLGRLLSVDSPSGSYPISQLPLRATSKCSSDFRLLKRLQALPSRSAATPARDYSDRARRAPQRRPRCAGTCAFRPAARPRRGGPTSTSSSSGAERLPVEPDPALVQQPPGLAAGGPEVLGQQRRQVHHAVRDQVRARERHLLDLLGRPVLLVDAVEVRLGRLGRRLRRGTAPRCGAPAPASASTGGSAAVDRVAQQQLVVGRPSRRRARSSACRTSPPADPSPRRSCRATCSSGARRRGPGRIGIVRIACGSWP